MALYNLGDVVSLARHASMSTTYKPALLKSLVKIAARSAELTIPLATIGHEFTKLYWNQTVIFHLRQAAVLSKEPEVIKSIRTTSEHYHVRDLRKLPPAASASIDRDMARILKINVLDRFHASKPPQMPPLFTWPAAQPGIILSDGAHTFLRENGAALEVVANYWWASYLEKVNLLAPAIIEKVQLNGARRSSLAKFVTILAQSGEDRCFYCDEPFSGDRPVSVDHVLPWSFLLDDPLWDLVLACAPCNAAKSDRLPEKSFVIKLAAANQRRTKMLSPRLVSPLIEDAMLHQLFDAAISLEWPGFWSPATKQPA
jgi:hypothetical protein